jgi:hypothetical protein
MSEETWHAARLIPTSGINGAEEQERRATSALLAVMASVREFGRAITQPIGAPAGTVQTFIEVPFELGEKRVYPDGLIRVVRGQRQWTALVEVKTGGNELATEQLEAYLDVARDRGYDALLTISNEIPPVAGQHPTKVDNRKLKKVALHHLSWTQVLTEAVMQKEFRGVADPDQAWILSELIRYLEHPRSGAMQFSDMGTAWVPVREAVAAGTLRPADKGLPEVTARFDALLRYTCLQLGRRLGRDVTPALTRKELAEPIVRAQALTAELCNSGTLSGAIKIPDTAGVLHVIADLRAGQIVCHVELDAPREGRPTTRVSWLVRQLRNAPEVVRLEAFAMHARGAGTAALLAAVRTDAATLISDPKRELRAFRIAQSFPMGSKRGTGRGAFIDSVTGAIDTFYETVVQNLKPWAPAPPRLRSDEASVARPADVPAALVSTALSSQDETEGEPDRTPDSGLELLAAADRAEAGDGPLPVD